MKARVVQTRGLNFNHNRMLKAIFKARHDRRRALRTESAARGYDRQLENGTKPNLAKLTVARQIAAIVLAMWKTQEEYDPGKIHNLVTH